MLWPADLTNIDMETTEKTPRARKTDFSNDVLDRGGQALTAILEVQRLPVGFDKGRQ
jgi:hypothetical protein